MSFFKYSEFQHRDKMDPFTIDTLELFRGDLGFPIILTADACTGGHSSDSWHYYDDATGKKGKAVDGTTEAPLWDFIFKARKAGFVGIGVYLQDGLLRYFHLDTRNTAPTFWLGIVKSPTVTQYIYKLGGK